MKKKAFAINTVILATTSLILSAAGIYFRAFVASKIGAEGVGLYQLISTVYLLAATFATSGISTAVTRLISEESAKGRGTRAITRRCFVLAGVFGILSCLFLFAGAPAIAAGWLGDDRCILSLRVMALDLPFLSLSSCLSGYFYAKRKAIFHAGTQIVEQLSLVVILMMIIETLTPLGLEYGCLSVVIASSAAEILSCGCSFLFYRFTDKGPADRAKGDHSLRKVLKIALPVAGSSYLRTSLVVLENLIIPYKLIEFGQTRELSLSQFGMIKGMVIPILFFPSALIYSFSRLLVPEIAEAKALGKQDEVMRSVGRIVQFTLLLSILVAGVFLFFSSRLAMAIYHSEQAGALIRILAPLIPLMYLDNIVDAILKGLGQQNHSLMINIFDSIIRIFLIYLLIPRYGLLGFLAVLYCSNILNPMLSILRLISVTGLEVSVAKWIASPILAAVSSGVAVLLLEEHCSLFDSIGFSIVFMIVIYGFLLRFLGSLQKGDLLWIRRLFVGQRKKQSR